MNLDFKCQSPRVNVAGITSECNPHQQSLDGDRKTQGRDTCRDKRSSFHSPQFPLCYTLDDISDLLFYPGPVRDYAMDFSVDDLPEVIVNPMPEVTSS